MREIKVRGRRIAIHLIMAGEQLQRKELDKSGHTVYVFMLSNEKIEELKAYIKKQRQIQYY